MRKAVLLGLTSLLAAAAAFAAVDPVKERQEILKGIGDETKPVVGMMKGEVPYDQAKVDALLSAYVSAAAKLPALFPPGSDKGKTEALPRIWTEKARFDQLYEKLGADAKATQGKIADAAGLKANLPKILGDCKACHDDFRQKK
ncbi:c-type cytochrome [Methylocella sp.]|uniref:c-type cytochrome n=1 Tax=Methylocella sp. TaxID=1978226 RepID=UPI0037842841